MKKIIILFLALFAGWLTSTPYEPVMSADGALYALPIIGMGTAGLSSRAIIGEFYARLSQNIGTSWIDPISMLFTSDQASENYKWLGMAPAMREWVGGRQAKGFRENGITIENKEYEATLEVLVSELRRDKTGQVLTRIRDLADRTNAHWAKLLSALVINGESSLCYDGQYFFDTDHSEGDSGTQSNDITSDVATTTAPTAAEMEKAILAGVAQILGFKDDQGEPMNEEATSFRVMVPVPFMASAAAAIKNPVIVDGSGSRTNTITNIGGFNIALDVNARLSWTDRFSIFRADGNVKPFIRQQEEDVVLSAVAEGSELEFKHKKHEYGVSAIRNVGYGYWQHACLVTLV
ncbi:MAG: Mu-like prophage major head subunit gpT family protein [Nitrospinota bacterium]|nr:Mu-like prophage major head subunit gpT family protein [Nitrospinota bacterium]